MKNVLKKILIIPLVAICSLSLASCGLGKGTIGFHWNATTTNEAGVEIPAMKIEKMHFICGEFTYTVNDFILPEHYTLSNLMTKEVKEYFKKEGLNPVFIYRDGYFKEHFPIDPKELNTKQMFVHSQVIVDDEYITNVAKKEMNENINVNFPTSFKIQTSMSRIDSSAYNTRLRYDKNTKLLIGKDLDSLYTNVYLDFDPEKEKIISESYNVETEILTYKQGPKEALPDNLTKKTIKVSKEVIFEKVVAFATVLDEFLFEGTIFATSKFDNFNNFQLHLSNYDTLVSPYSDLYFEFDLQSPKYSRIIVDRTDANLDITAFLKIELYKD